MDAAKKLGIDYLWIVSLCIIQDLPDDWGLEASLMSQIYYNCYCTICNEVSDAENGQKNMVRALREEKEYIWHLSKGILLDRGWCFQERESSPRILHYTPSKVFWDCRAFKASEDWPTRDVSRDLKLDRGRSSNDSRDYGRFIDRIVAKDAPDQLTMFEDKMPAVARLAPLIAWKRTWFNGPPTRRTPPAVKPASNAPSWSWASIDGGISFNDLTNDLRIDLSNVRHHFSDGSSKCLAVIHGYKVDSQASDPFLRILSAELSIYALLATCFVQGSEINAALSCILALQYGWPR
ncbi:hypothetical protein S7711_09817 [Stachybotrys chartarum IBT 7711]|uniref:Heterokaryon incompatibility domain-containing protein n=1 Tax=Stachybotrys chartarum (strain CBS 109288 / IBT 7711) TaxID=1280523 RepID=A0A084B2X0_STACB|nr:hypothetical protein S7711_09817 [Stachybotrys chartarum IBT 7711]